MNARTVRNWLITGCDSGIGYALAEAALGQGDRVAITVLAPRGESPLRDTFPDRCRSYCLDIRDAQAVTELAATVERELGSIDVLVNNAGYGLIGTAEETSPAEYRQMFEVNLFGMVELTRAALPGMRRRRSGHIFCFSSVAGFVAFPGFSLYSASKFAVEGFAESLAKEVQPFGIRITIIEPGGFRTNFGGSSLARARTVIEEYATAPGGQVRQFMDSRHGKQPGDPVRLGAAICRIAALADPPLRIAFGQDALPLVLQKAEFVQAEAERWRELSLSSSFPEGQ